MRRLLLVTGLLLAGCTTGEAGTPTGGEEPQATTTTTTTTATTTTATTTTTTTTTGSARPKDVDVAGLDVCELVTSLPRATFGLDQDRPPIGEDSMNFPGSKECFANGIDKNLALKITAVVDQGASEFAEVADAEVSESDVDGFPLYLLKPSMPHSCFGALDVADGKMIYLNYGLSAPGSEPVTPQATLCSRVPQIAAAVVAKL